MMIKGSIQDDITIINMYAPDMGAPQYTRQMRTAVREETASNTVIVGDWNGPLIPVGRPSRQEINTEAQSLNDTLDQLNLIDVCRAFHPKTMDFTFFSSARGTFSRTDYILGQKSSRGKF